LVSIKKAFRHGYILAYTQELPYNQGRDAGQKNVDMLISRCHVFNNPHIPSHHTAAWRRGWIEAYGDDANDAWLKIVNGTQKKVLKLSDYLTQAILSNTI
jgi:hypothetical protein